MKRHDDINGRNSVQVILANLTVDEFSSIDPSSMYTLQVKFLRHQRKYLEYLVQEDGDVGISVVMLTTVSRIGTGVMNDQRP